MLITSAAVGWFGRGYTEQTADFSYHVTVLTPFLAYDRDHYDLGSRAMNDDMRLVAFQLHAAAADGLDLERVLDHSMPIEQVPSNLKILTMARLLENHQQGIEYGLFTSENLNLLARGKAPTITRGNYSGQRADVEHIVPRNIVPAMDNLLANLEWLPQSLNSSKSDTITERARNYGKKYFEQGIISESDYLMISTEDEANE